jgi:hypothetical protein
MSQPRMPAYLASRSFPSIAAEQTPNSAPEPKGYVGESNSPEEIAEVGSRIHMYAYLSYDLVEYAWRLAEISWERRGGYETGLELPTSARAAAAGAVALAYAALEAAVNEYVVNLHSSLERDGDPARARLAELSIKLSLGDRLDAVAAISGHSIDWGADPVFQRFELFVAVRNQLLHHRLGTGLLTEGYWPVKRLRELLKQIESPYQSRSGLHWYDHVLTPAGAIWAVNVACNVLSTIDRWWGKRVGPRSRKRRRVKAAHSRRGNRGTGANKRGLTGQ